MFNYLKTRICYQQISKPGDLYKKSTDYNNLPVDLAPISIYYGEPTREELLKKLEKFESIEKNNVAMMPENRPTVPSRKKRHNGS